MQTNHRKVLALLNRGCNASEVAEEVGLEMVIICGNNMGDIFRRNSFNLGLHVVQSPEADDEGNQKDADDLRDIRRSGHDEPSSLGHEPACEQGAEE